MSERAKVFLAGVLVAVAIAGLWFVLLWKPTGEKLSKAEEREQVATAQAEQLQTKLATLKALERRAPQLQADRELLLRAVPSEDQVDQFLVNLNDTANEAGVSWLSVSQAQPSGSRGGAGGPVSIGIQLQVTGDYFSILRFMDLIRDTERLITVQNFSLSGEGTEMSASIGGQMFMAPDETPAGAATSGSGSATNGGA